MDPESQIVLRTSIFFRDIDLVEHIFEWVQVPVWFRDIRAGLGKQACLFPWHRDVLLTGELFPLKDDSKKFMRY